MTRRRLLTSLGPPIVFGLAFLGLWEAVVRGFDLKPYFLSAPSKIVEAIGDNVDNVWDATVVSGTNALVGLVIGTLLGVAVSFALMRFRVLDDLVTPLAVALNAIPIFVLVTVFNNMFAITSEVPRRLMVTIVVYFIVLVNVAKGLRQVQPTHLELLRSYAASPTAVLSKARIPNAVPYLFTALRIAAPAAVITAFVAEYFGGSQNGLGYGITSNSAGSKNAVAWAYVVGACTLGLVFFLIAVSLESYINTRRGLGPGGGTT
ncbi:MAG: ABC transporter permease subunit [Acidimicrobiia bacterium]|jgi:NitT/TauT family transport system permease protein|nr:ABC transporter permease subunit [Acidimicrobiia bacterium]MDQ3392185.1 ABC transporter permease subunit [Actinomycetota bacterium]